MATEFIVKLADRPGQLATLANALGEAGVNLRAIGANKGTVGIIVSDADTAKARRALKKGKYRATERKAVEVRLKDKPGALGRTAGRFGKKKVNLSSASKPSARAPSRAMPFAALKPHETKLRWTNFGMPCRTTSLMRCAFSSRIRVRSGSIAPSAASHSGMDLRAIVA